MAKDLFFIPLGGEGGGGGGAQGPRGFQGSTGAQGIMGYQGLQGLQGYWGAQGTAGQSGLQGLQGIMGQDGSQGTAGQDGLQGYVGLQGPMGLQGFIGIQGPAGGGGSSSIKRVEDMSSAELGELVEDFTAYTSSHAVYCGGKPIVGIQFFEGTWYLCAVPYAYRDYYSGQDLIEYDIFVVRYESGVYIYDDSTPVIGGVDLTLYQHRLTAGSGITIEDQFDELGWWIQTVVSATGGGGAQGIQGIQGNRGYQGTSGTNGLQGLQGYYGHQGTAGQDGLQGPMGLQGPAGGGGGSDRLDVSQLSQLELVNFYTNYATEMATKDLYWGVYPITAVNDYVYSVQGTPVTFRALTYRLEATFSSAGNPLVNTDLQLIAPDGTVWAQTGNSVELASYTALQNKQDVLTQTLQMTFTFTDSTQAVYDVYVK